MVVAGVDGVVVVGCWVAGVVCCVYVVIACVVGGVCVVGCGLLVLFVVFML